MNNDRRVQRINGIYKSVASAAAARARNSFLVLFLTLFAMLAQIGRADDHLAKDAHADKVLVLKSERTLELLDQGEVLMKYKVALVHHGSA